MSAVAVDWDANAIGEGPDFARFALLGALLQKHISNGSVLDIGCDTGKLKDLLGEASYLGIDARAEAIEAAKRRFPQLRFICARAEEWKPDQMFDAVVFNESLYYLENFAVVLRKFHRFLRQGGLLAISIYKHPRRFSPNSKALRAVRQFIMGRYLKIYDITITSEGSSWNVLIARKQLDALYV